MAKPRICVTRKHISAREAKLNKLLAEYTGQSLKKVEKDIRLDNWMTAEEAVEYGLIDKVHKSRGE